MQRVIGIIIITIFIASCKEKAIIPEKDMVQILSKIQIIDASVQHNIYMNSFFNKDTIDYYKKTIESFGYTKEQFDSSLSFYSRNPKELDAIYDNVIIELSKMQTQISSLTKARSDSLVRDSLKNYWNLKTSIQLPMDDALGTINFSIPTAGQGLYTISADVRVFNDDETNDPSMTAYFYFDDKSKDGNQSSFFKETFRKGLDTVNYTIQMELQNSLVTHLKGSLFSYKQINNPPKRHALIENIKVNYKPISFKKKVKVKRPKVPLSEVEAQ